MTIHYTYGKTQCLYCIMIYSKSSIICHGFNSCGTNYQKVKDELISKLNALPIICCHHPHPWS